MAAPTAGSLPPFYTLTQGVTVRVTALDPSTGSTVAGVSISNFAISVDQEQVGDTEKPIPLSGDFLPA
jgi:hypothetical protein